MENGNISCGSSCGAMNLASHEPPKTSILPGKSHKVPFNNHVLEITACARLAFYLSLSLFPSRFVLHRGGCVSADRYQTLLLPISEATHGSDILRLERFLSRRIRPFRPFPAGSARGKNREEGSNLLARLPLCPNGGD